MRNGFAGTAFLVALLAGCSQVELPGKAEASAASTSASVELALPPIDDRSPDTIVKSYWARQDWQRQYLKGASFSMPKEFTDGVAAFLDVSAGDLHANTAKELEGLRNPLADYSDHQLAYQRDILSVTPESETRAVVLAKILNVTPIPPGYSLSPDDLAERLAGVDVRYVTEKTAEGWRVTQAYVRDSYSKRMAKTTKDPQDEWRRRWEPPKPESPWMSSFRLKNVEP